MAAVLEQLQRKAEKMSKWLNQHVRFIVKHVPLCLKPFDNFCFEVLCCPTFTLICFSFRIIADDLRIGRRNSSHGAEHRHSSRYVSNPTQRNTQDTEHRTRKTEDAKLSESLQTSHPSCRFFIPCEIICYWFAPLVTFTTPLMQSSIDTRYQNYGT